MELRVLVHAPRGRDATVVKGVLEPQHTAHVCDDPDELLQQMNEGAAAAIVTEEALADRTLVEGLAAWLAVQPSWSDFAFIVLATRHPAPRSPHAVSSLHSLGNVILLERPLNAETLASAADAAVRARGRQYATRRTPSAVTSRFSASINTASLTQSSHPSVPARSACSMDVAGSRSSATPASAANRRASS